MSGCLLVIDIENQPYFIRNDLLINSNQACVLNAFGIDLHAPVTYFAWPYA